MTGEDQLIQRATQQQHLLTIQQGLASVEWLGHNAHNIRTAPNRFYVLFKAVVEDCNKAKAALEELKKSI